MSLSYLPGTASLLEELDKKLMVLLRDGRYGMAQAGKEAGAQRGENRLLTLLTLYRT